MITVREKQLVDLVGSIYGAALNPASWVGTLRDLANVLDCSSGYLFTNAAPQTVAPLSFFGSDRVDPRCQGDYLDYYFAIDPRQPVGTGLPTGAIYTDRMLFPDGGLEGTELMNDFLDRYELQNTGGIVISNDGATQILLSVSANRSHGPFSVDSLDVLALLAPHFRQALCLQMQSQGVACHADLMAEGIDRLRCGACIVDATARVIRLNQVGERILARADGLRLSDGRLVCMKPEADRELLRQLAQSRGGPIVAGDSFRDCLRVDRRAGSPYLLRVVPLPDPDSNRDQLQTQILVLMMDPDDRPLPDDVVLQQLYGLTPAERRVALALTKGQLLSEIARDSNTSISTVRTHVKRILQKTGVRSQVGLVRELLYVAALARGSVRHEEAGAR